MRIGRFWHGTAIGAVAGCLLTLGGIAVADRIGDDPLGPAGELSIASGVDDSPGQERQALLDLWNAANPHHKAHVLPIALTTTGQHSAMVTQTGVDIYCPELLVS